MIAMMMLPIIIKRSDLNMEVVETYGESIMLKKVRPVQVIVITFQELI